LNDAAFRAFWLTVGSLLRLAFRLRVEGPPLPAGPCVIVANHVSFLDPLLLGAGSRRRIVFLMDAVIYRTPPLRWFYRWNRAIPVDPRGNNRQALRQARAALADGHVLGVFPEGGISRDGRLGRGNPGAVALALASEAPLVPVGILGTAEALPPHRRRLRLHPVRLRFGTPLPAEHLLAGGSGGRKQRLESATRQVMEEIAALVGQRSRESELAG
jgi:1-acyl-sn-glycerol-3-phosphate acyltransferase